MSSLFFHEYEMRARGALNALSARDVFRGALLRAGDGFACLHPWPELGDDPIEGQLARLRNAESTPLIARALRCAGLDAVARREGRNLFEGMEIPESHALMIGDGSIEEVSAAGFKAIKLKCGARISEERKRIDAMAARLGDTDVLLRLDFNEVLEEESFRAFAGGLAGATLERIAFVEDPFPYEADAWERAWRECGVTLAIDRSVGNGVSGGFRYAVLKPAIDDVEALAPVLRDAGKGLVFTSYMDHPLGQFFAAFEAARAVEAGPVETCGLLTHALFEEDAFIERVRCEGPRLFPAEGTGLGFDELLESLPWKRLT